MIASIVIPTYNGAKKLPATLEALCLQTQKDFETIVVIDGSSDRSIEVLKAFEDRLQLKIYNQPNKGRSGARNTGVKLATAELIIFIDDDIAVGTDNIERHVAFHKGKSGDVLVGKPSMEKARVKGNSFLEYRARREAEWNRKHGTSLKQVSYLDYVFTTQNVSMLKSDFELVGGLDERLPDMEDFDLSVRLMQIGRTIFYDPSLNVLHHDYGNLEATIRRQIQYYESKVKVLELHPEYRSMLQKEFEWSRNKIKNGLKALMFKSTAWEKIFESPLFKSLPNSVKDNFYSSYIYTKSVLIVKPKLYGQVN